MAWMTPKFDWTADDYWNAADINRLENNTQEVRNYLLSIQYDIPAMTFVTNRSYTYADFLSSINRIEQNLDTVRSSFLTPPGYLAMKSWVAKKTFDFTDVNRLEYNVKILYDYGLLVYSSFRHCGAYTCGDQGGLY
jgi:hypothetical protein